MSGSQQHPLKTVVILGDFDHEGISAVVESLGLRLDKKHLYRVSSNTWIKRAKHIEEMRLNGNLAGIILYMPTPLFIKAADNKYRDAWLAILNELKASPSIIFMFEQNLELDFSVIDFENDRKLTYEDLEKLLKQEVSKKDNQNFISNMRDQFRERFKDYEDQDFVESYDTYERFEGKLISDSYFLNRLQTDINRLKLAKERHQELEQILSEIHESNIEVAPFIKRNEVTIRIQQFLEELEDGAFLRLYVPHARYQSEQFQKFLSTFERYLREVEGRSFSIDSRKTANGTVYIFKGNNPVNDKSDLNTAIYRFDDFMKLCRDNPIEAQQLFESNGIVPAKAGHLVNKYHRDFQRLILDTKHEFENKVLILRQRLETDLFEEINVGLSSELEANRVSSVMVISGYTAPSTLKNFLNQQSTSIQSEIGQILNDGIVYSQNDNILISLFNQFANRLNAIQLQSNLEQLRDIETLESERRTAKQKISSFLYKAKFQNPSVFSDVSFDELIEYIESLLLHKNKAKGKQN